MNLALHVRAPVGEQANHFHEPAVDGTRSSASAHMPAPAATQSARIAAFSAVPLSKTKAVGQAGNVANRQNTLSDSALPRTTAGRSRRNLLA